MNNSNNGIKLTILDTAVHPLCPWKSHDLCSLLWTQSLEIDCASALPLPMGIVIVPIDTVFLIADSLLFWRPFPSASLKIPIIS